uniref:Uncharacterized protein n=1 Tax=Amphimedon queenslandica TaxID=400682 RepID=A0A1X7SQK1_AMPQE
MSMISNVPFYCHIQLWSVSNYHWYLKQEIQSSKTTPTDETTPTHYTGVVWDPIVPLHLHTLLNNGQYIQYNWKRGVVTSTSLNVNNNSTVAVIDGEVLLLTPFRDVIIPPPMSHKRLMFPSPVVMATFCPTPYPQRPFYSTV